MRTIQLTVDLTDVPRRLAHVEANLPVRPNTTASFTTPLWLCASHKPNGPAIASQVSHLPPTMATGRLSGVAIPHSFIFIMSTFQAG